MTEAQLSSFFASSAGFEALAYMAKHRLTPADVMTIIYKVRKDVWWDRSSPSPQAVSLASRLGWSPPSSSSSGSTGGSSDE